VQDEELLELEKKIEASKRMSSIEFIGWAIFIAGMLFYLDIWLSGIYKERVAASEFPIVVHTDADKAVLCKAWKTCEEMSKALVYEARGEGRTGMKAVAFVIQNRTEHNKWPNTVVEVIHQPKQFSFLADWRKQRTPSEKDWTTARAVAYNVLHKRVEDTTGGATHYTEKSIQRSWMKNLEYVTTINNHKFFRGDN